MNANIAGYGQLLLTRVENGVFSSLVDARLDEVRTDPLPQAFYPRILREKGKDAAEAELLKWASQNADHRVGDALGSIIIALGSLLLTGRNALQVSQFQPGPGSIMPFPLGASTSAFGFAITNPAVPGCGCDKIPGTDKFAPDGTLQIKRFVVILDQLKPSKNSFALMLPIRDEREGNKNRRGFVVVTMGRDGSMKSELREVILNEDAAERIAFGGGSPYWVKKDSGGGLGGYVGLPYAQEYITSSLADLPMYLLELGIRLNPEHAH